MPGEPRSEISDLRASAGELAFTARVGDLEKEIWLRTDTAVTPEPDAALAACLMPAMAVGGTLRIEQPLSPRLLRNQREYQAIQTAWSRRWPFAKLREVEVEAPARAPGPPRAQGRVAAFFSGGVDSWSTVLAHPELTDLIFVRGTDLMLDAPHQAELADEVEGRLREAAGELGLPLHVVETNLRTLSDPLVAWEAYFGCSLAAVSLFFAPLFERVLIAGTTDFEMQEPIACAYMVSHLLGTEQIELCDDGGRYDRVQRTAMIAGHPVVQRSLRVCWENPGGAYNCGRCRKCQATMATLEALGRRQDVTTFPPELDLDRMSTFAPDQLIHLHLLEDVLDQCRRGGRADLEAAMEPVVARGRARLGLSPGYRGRALPGPPPTVRIAVVVPVWRQAEYMAAAVRSALEQEIETGVGVVIVNDGCPDPETDRIGQLLRDAHPDRVAYVHQPNRGLSAARNAGIRRALARWPHTEAIFPLDADNMLSPGTLARLRALLAENSEAAWATPALEFFGGEEGSWEVPGPFLAYRQLFTNQCDAGSLIRRSTFEAGHWFDETMTDGFEDWEFFLRAALAGLKGVQAGRCGFRYRRRPGSMLAHASAEAESIEAEIRRRHADAYRPGARAHREHHEAPRFALVRCDAGDVLLTAACDLDPHRIGIEDLLRPRRGDREVNPVAAHVPAITVIASAALFDLLAAEGSLAETLLRLQYCVHENVTAGLRLEPRRSRLGRRARSKAGGAVALAMRTRVIAETGTEFVSPHTVGTVTTEVSARRPPEPLTATTLEAAVSRMMQSLDPGQPLIAPLSQPQFFEAMHVDRLETTLPWSGPEANSYEVPATEAAA